jgi:hypothetical protein
MSLTPEQQRCVADARALLAASRTGRAALAAHIHAHTPGDPGSVYAEAVGWTTSTIEDLLAIIDGLTGGAS